MTSSEVDSILNAPPVEVATSIGHLALVELPATAWLSILERLSATTATALQVFAPAPSAHPAVDEILRLITSSIDFSASVVAQASGRPLDEIKTLPPRVILRLVARIVAQNAGPDFFAAAGEVTAGMGIVLPPTAPSEASSSPSAPPATP